MKIGDLVRRTTEVEDFLYVLNSSGLGRLYSANEVFTVIGFKDPQLSINDKMIILKELPEGVNTWFMHKFEVIIQKFSDFEELI